jgi:hypothetical protein
MTRTRTSFEDLDGGHASRGHCFSFGWAAATWEAIAAGAATYGPAAAAVVGAVGVGVAVAGQDQSRRLQNQAQDAATATATANARLSDEAVNRANQKAPDSAASMAANVLAGKAGQSGTMLTGPQGIDPNSLLLGKTTLLGGATASIGGGRNTLLGG